MQLKTIAACSLVLTLLSGCALKEIRSKTRVGPEFVHSGSTNTNSERWMVEQGLEFRWDKGITTGVVYRRRDVDDGNGNNENRVLLEFSFPLWKAESQQATLARRVQHLQNRLDALESAAEPGDE